MALSQAEITTLEQQNRSGFNYELPDGTIIRSAINPDQAATVKTIGILSGQVASPIPGAILQVAKQQVDQMGAQYKPLYKASTKLEQNGRIINPGETFDPAQGDTHPLDPNYRGEHYTRVNALDPNSLVIPRAGTPDETPLSDRTDPFS